MLYSFLFFLLIFVLIGVMSTFSSKANNKDYLLAGHSMSPWLVALSAVATNNSGYMFTGMIGYTYKYGLSSVWIMAGWILGDFLGSLLIHKKIRQTTQEQNVLSFGGVLSRWNGTDYKRLRLLVGIITIIFLGTYAAAQLKAGSKALHVLFGWDYSIGAIIGSIIVFVYCMAGGIRASIWTDAAQSFVMIIAMSMLLYFSVDALGGINNFIHALNNISDNYMSITPKGLEDKGPSGIFLFFIGWVVAGFGVVGQPHIMVRFMTLDRPRNINRVRVYYYSWFSAFYLATICVGMAARLILVESASFDAELALPKIAQQLLPGVLVGLVLAGLFAATMSTADSQILSCSAALTRDVLPKEKDNYFVTKLGTLLVTVISLMVALFGTDNVFNLVLLSWSILASTLGPMLIVYALNQKISENMGILMILTGGVSCILWRELGLGATLYEAAPGMVIPLFIYLILRKTIWNQG